MKGRDVEKLCRRYVLGDLPDFTCKRSLLFSSPVVHLLRGFYFESSAFDADAFYLWVFVQPLYVPCDSVCFDFGMRLSGNQGQGWTMDRRREDEIMADVLASMKDHGLYFLSRAQTPGDLARKALLLGGSARNPHTAEAVAYSCILEREFPAAYEQLRRLEALIEGADEIYPWMEELLDRGRQVRGRLDEDPNLAIALLEEWNEQTRAGLGLPRD